MELKFKIKNKWNTRNPKLGQQEVKLINQIEWSDLPDAQVATRKVANILEKSEEDADVATTFSGINASTDIPIASICVDSKKIK